MNKEEKVLGDVAKELQEAEKLRVSQETVYGVSDWLGGFISLFCCHVE